MPGWFYALLGWMGGIAATVAGAYISGRFQNYEQERKAHRDDLRDKVLVPLRAGLDQYVRPLLTGLTPTLQIEHAATAFDPKARVTEEPSKSGPVLVATFPSAAVFAPIPSALLHDARTNHLSGLFAKFDGLYKDWMAYNGECHAWANKLAWWILEGSGLPAFPNDDPAGLYVMHYGLAVFLYHRLFRYQTFALRKKQERSGFWLLGGNYTFAVGTEESIDSLLATLNGFLDSENEPTLRLRNSASALHSRYDEFAKELDYAIVSRRLHGKCDLVSFF